MYLAADGLGGQPASARRPWADRQLASPVHARQARSPPVKSGKMPNFQSRANALRIPLAGERLIVGRLCQTPLFQMPSRRDGLQCWSLPLFTRESTAGSTEPARERRATARNHAAQYRNIRGSTTG